MSERQQFTHHFNPNSFAGRHLLPILVECDVLTRKKDKGQVALATMSPILAGGIALGAMDRLFSMPEIVFVGEIDPEATTFANPAFQDEGEQLGLQFNINNAKCPTYPANVQHACNTKGGSSSVECSVGPEGRPINFGVESDGGKVTITYRGEPLELKEDVTCGNLPPEAIVYIPQEDSWVPDSAPVQPVPPVDQESPEPGAEQVSVPQVPNGSGFGSEVRSSIKDTLHDLKVAAIDLVLKAGIALSTITFFTLAIKAAKRQRQVDGEVEKENVQRQRLFARRNNRQKAEEMRTRKMVEEDASRSGRTGIRQGSGFVVWTDPTGKKYRDKIDINSFGIPTCGGDPNNLSWTQEACRKMENTLGEQFVQEGCVVEDVFVDENSYPRKTTYVTADELNELNLDTIAARFIDKTF